MHAECPIRPHVASCYHITQLMSWCLFVLTLASRVFAECFESLATVRTCQKCARHIRMQSTVRCMTHARTKITRMVLQSEGVSPDAQKKMMTQQNLSTHRTEPLTSNTAAIACSSSPTITSQVSSPPLAQPAPPHPNPAPETPPPDSVWHGRIRSVTMPTLLANPFANPFEPLSCLPLSSP